MTEHPRAADEGHAEEQGHRPGMRSSRRPRYLKIAETLREEIRVGVHVVGRRLPGEVDLCKRFKASRYTLREALRHLEEAGLILRRRGSGTLVRSAEVQVSYEQHIRTIDDLLQFTNATGFQYLHTDRIQADSTLAGWLNLRVGIECIHLHGIRYHRRTALPYCLGEVYRRASWQGLPQGFARMEDALRHVMEKEFEQRIGYAFTERELLRRALTHKSYSHEAKDLDVRHNARDTVSDIVWRGDAASSLSAQSKKFSPTIIDM